ncbi:MAG: anthranilate synthase component I family protein [Myxococcota bacterium]
MSDFWRRVQALQRRDGFVLLASGEGLGRWSIACCEPREVVTARGDAVTIRHADGREERVTGSPFDVLEARLGHAEARPDVPFSGGWAGWIGYEAGRRLELPDLPDKPGASTPDVAMGLYDDVLLLDHVTGRVTVVGEPPGDEADVPPIPAWAPARVTADFAREDYEAAVARVREYVLAGDVYQVNLTQRLHAPLGERDPWDCFRALLRVNPSPYAAFLRFGDVVVASASPERFVEVGGGWVTTRPIKGTAPRGATPAEDAAALRRLLASEKDLAELTMIVDLLRNDLGRVCDLVEVVAFPEAETYATVHHLVATIRGRLARGRSVWDVLRASLPGGSITGAPKIRAMEIADELEPVRRGVYTGAVGYVGRDGRADLNVAIRTAIVADGTVHLHGGGGVVLDSSPRGEHDEALLKLRRMVEAFGFQGP